MHPQLFLVSVLERKPNLVQTCKTSLLKMEETENTHPRAPSVLKHIHTMRKPLFMNSRSNFVCLYKTNYSDCENIYSCTHQNYGFQ